jgi:4-carboxymuconolactone decarboxylase
VRQKGSLVDRIERITEKSQIDPEQYDEFDAISAVLGHVSGPFSALMHSPGLAQKVMEAGAQIRTRSTLTMGERELIILAVAREKDGVYEWSAHVALARKNGVPESTIDVVRKKGDLAELPAEERDIVAYTRELLQTNRVSDALYHALVGRKGVRWVVELTATIGQYQYIAAINNAFEVEPPPGAEILPV